MYTVEETWQSPPPLATPMPPLEKVFASLYSSDLVFSMNEKTSPGARTVLLTALAASFMLYWRFGFESHRKSVWYSPITSFGLYLWTSAVDISGLGAGPSAMATCPLMFFSAPSRFARVSS